MSSLTSRALSRWIMPTLVFVAPMRAFAQGFGDRVLDGATQAGGPSGLTQTGPLEVVIGNIIGALLSLVGVILICIMIYAGFLWMTAGGDDAKVKKAREMILNSIIGLVIIFAAYAITQFVIERLMGVTTGASDVSSPS